jgi:hypothetical protein
MVLNVLVPGPSPHLRSLRHDGAENEYSPQIINMWAVCCSPQSGFASHLNFHLISLWDALRNALPTLTQP